MPYFALTREPGRNWDHARPMREQDEWEAHAAFMDRLAAEGFVVLGGPVGDGMRFQFAVEAASEEQIEARLAGDPWAPMGLLRTAKIEPWEILLERKQRMQWKLELVAIPVSDVDRAKAFYTEKAGFTEDHDHRVSEEIRFVQLTPPGSACSIALGSGLVDTPPGSTQGLQLVVPDIAAARAELVDRGVEVSEVEDFPWGSFVFFRDPDGNGWSVQQIPDRE
jgi:catechol 2,3-dioxygenase-like lactoylglutathione lyase family enzyme/uncharacterized protein YciI